MNYVLFFLDILNNVFIICLSFIYGVLITNNKDKLSVRYIVLIFILSTIIVLLNISNFYTIIILYILILLLFKIKVNISILIAFCIFFISTNYFLILNYIYSILLIISKEMIELKLGFILFQSVSLFILWHYKTYIDVEYLSDIISDKTYKDIINVKKFFIYFFCNIFLSTILFLSCLLLNIKLNTVTLFNNIVKLFVVIVCYLSYLFFINLEISLIKSLKNNNVENQYKKEVQGFMEVIRSQRHDFNFHLQSIHGMIYNNKFDECKKYVENMVKDVQQVSEVVPLYYPAISAMLTSFREMALSKDITMNIEIRYNMKDVNCSIYDINRILGNLLQNAIDELSTKNYREKVITVNILQRMNMCIMTVSNKISNKNKDDFKTMYNFGHTSKNMHDGIGLHTVNKIVKKNNGLIHTEFDDNNINIVIYIPIKNI